MMEAMGLLLPTPYSVEGVERSSPHRIILVVHRTVAVSKDACKPRPERESQQSEKARAPINVTVSVTVTTTSYSFVHTCHNGKKKRRRHHQTAQIGIWNQRDYEFQSAPRHVRVCPSPSRHVVSFPLLFSLRAPHQSRVHTFRWTSPASMDVDQASAQRKAARGS